jgi:hypothetical protein
VTANIPSPTMDNRCGRCCCRLALGDAMSMECRQCHVALPWSWCNAIRKHHGYGVTLVSPFETRVVTNA